MITNFPHFDKVEGWLQPQALMFTSYYADRFLGGKPFDALEIGVHHGKFFIGIENLTPLKGRCLAVDVFSDQDKNIDNSGSGSLSMFNENIAKHATSPERVLPIEMDSLDLVPEELGKNRFGIISIDGGHTTRHTINDLISAQMLLSPAGIVILDDITNQDWTGVMTGAIKFFTSDLSTKLIPFGIGFNKLYCCHYSSYDKVKKQIISDQDYLKEIGMTRFKLTTFAAHEIISIK